ncbi:MAG: glutamate--tRNA ligase [Christensenellales bacterium]
MTVRTRFAPSPTGYLHIGGLRTALYAWLFAKKNNGKFILRIEDTDQKRFVEGAVEKIYNALHETGLLWDEGPDIGGGFGPYVQSERAAIYKQYAGQLVEIGKAYYCFCSEERLTGKRNEYEARGETFQYDKHCRNIPPAEAKARIAGGEPYVIRQDVPASGQTAFVDMVYGAIAVDNATLEDVVLMKSDGMPTYNFANVVDDHLMGITHVIRGSEYLSSTPKYNLLYEAFGWDIPTYIHLPSVMKDANRKLSKRYGDAAYEDFIAKGYLKDAIVNYIALLGWNPGTNQEKFTLQELAEAFDVKGISKSPAIFDEQKLTWLNGEYIRAMEPDAFIRLAEPYFKKILPVIRYDKNILARILQPRVNVFSEIEGMLDFLSDRLEYGIELFTHKKMKTTAELSREVLLEALPMLRAEPDWTEETLHSMLIQHAQEKELKNGQVLWPLRVAVAGKEVTPGGAIEIMVLLGKKESLERIGIAIEKLEKV